VSPFPFALVALFAVGWFAVGWIADTTARTRLGDELLAAGVYPSWMPWTCPRCTEDCRKSLDPCPEAVRLQHPSRARGSWDSPALAHDRELFDEVARQEHDR
jgi:hypothetical protein